VPRSTPAGEVMELKRLVNILGAVLTATLLSAGVAAAASLAFSTGQLSAGHTAVAGCTSSSLTATRNVDNSGNVTQVNVLSVPQACAGETLAVTLENSSHLSLGSASTVVGACTGGCTVTLTGFGTVSASNLTAYALSLVQ
jgi:hypothetical protein